MPRPSAFIHSPSPTLGACVLVGVERDTRGCVLNDAQRVNHYPAHPVAGISWTFEGDVHWVEDHGSGARPTLSPVLPRIIFSGPQHRSFSSWTPGPVHALLVAFYPEALSRLIGQPIEPYFDQFLPLEAVAPPALLHACQSVLDARGHEPFAMLEALLPPIWRDADRATSPYPYISNWVRSLVTRAVHSPAGRSLRQLQRRIRDWTGQSHRDLQIFNRVEKAFTCYLDQTRDGSAMDIAAIAADAGYADQSHMGREIRRLTGFSPATFSERLESDESFWYYRLMESAFNQPR